MQLIREAKNHTGNQKKPSSSRWSTSILFTSFSKTTNHRKKINKAVILCLRLFSNIVEYRDHRWDLNKNSIPLDTYQRVQLECMKVQAHSALEIPLECNQDQKPLANQELWHFSPTWELQKCYAISDYF